MRKIKYRKFCIWREHLHKPTGYIWEMCTMKNVRIIEISVTDLNELCKAIKERFLNYKDMQVFISDVLFERLFQKNKSHIIWRELVLNSFVYCYGAEEAFIIRAMENNQTETVQVHFANICKGYKLLTYFASKGIVYRCYSCKMNTIVIINTN